MRLSDTMQNLLNRQYCHEIQNSLSYKLLESWAATKGMDNISDLFKKQAAGEIEHSNIIASFIADRDGALDCGTLATPEVREYAELKDVLRTALELETENTESLKDIAIASEAESDIQTVTFILNRMLPEQVEEEALFFGLVARAGWDTAGSIDAYIGEALEDEDEEDEEEDDD